MTANTTREKAPSSVRVQRVPLSSQQKGWLEKAYSLLDVKRAIQLNVDLTNIYSYTGYEKEINEFIVDYWRRLDINADYQEMDPTMGNAIAKLKGDGSGPTLLVICPSDVHWTGDPERDGLQWGDPMRRDNLLPAQVEGQTVIGLGSNNVKAMVASIMLAIEAIRKAEVPLRGTLVGGIAAGGAPATSPPEEQRKNVSLGVGVLHMLTHGLWGDFALYHKPGWQVGWEDTSMNYFKIRVRGNPQYMANESNPQRPYRVLTDTARIVMHMDKWAAQYRENAKGGTFTPAAAINSIRVGRPDKPNWSPAISEIFMDIRGAPWSSSIETYHMLEKELQKLKAETPGMDAEVEMFVSSPGGHTDPNSWIVQSAIRGSQYVDGDTSDIYVGRTAGQTEAGILHSWGIPTAKISGTPEGEAVSPELPDDISGFTMSGSYGPYLINAAKTMIYAIVDTLTRTREEVGLDY